MTKLSMLSFAILAILSFLKVRQEIYMHTVFVFMLSNTSLTPTKSFQIQLMCG